MRLFVGMPVGGVFKTDFRKPSVVVDRARQEEEVMGMAAELIRDHAGIGAIVCECTNLAPYSAKIASTFGLPVFDVVTLVNWFHSGLRPTLRRKLDGSAWARRRRNKSLSHNKKDKWT